MKLFKNITQNQLFKISSLNSVSLLVRIITGVLSSKAIAYFIGPSGMALLGNFRNFKQTLEAVGIVGIENGIIKTVAENTSNEQKLYNLVTTWFYSLVVIALVLSTIIFFGASYFSIQLFENLKYIKAIKLLAVMLPFSILHLFFVAVINGFRQYKNVIIISIFNYIFGLLLAVFLMWKYSIVGAMWALAGISFFLFCFTMYYLGKLFSIQEILNYSNFKFEKIKKIAVFASMTLFSASIAPPIFIYIRKLISLHQSIEIAGLYEAMNRVSSFYMLFISSLITLYYLPELSKTSLQQNKSIIQTYYKKLFPLFSLGLLVVYLCRRLIVSILFTNEFYAVSDLFLWQLIGDFFKAATLILAIQFFAKKMVIPYFVTEIISFTTLFVTSYFCIAKWGGEGAVIAHAITYFIYFISVAFYFRKQII